jgi:hypothetical protein
VSLACVIHIHVILARAELRLPEGQVAGQSPEVALPALQVAGQPSGGRTEERYRGLVVAARERGEHLSDRAAATELGVSRQRIATLRKRLLSDVEMSGALSVVGSAE